MDPKSIVQTAIEMSMVSSICQRLIGARPPAARLATPAERDQLLVDLARMRSAEETQRAFDDTLVAAHRAFHGTAPWIAAKVDTILRGALVVAGIPIDYHRVRLAS